MWTPEYFVRILDFPPTVEGVTIPNDDGTFDIYLSSHLSPQKQKACLEHELRHIFRDHFYSDRPVEDLEREADGLPPEERERLKKAGPRDMRGPAGTFINVLALPDPGLIPVFHSIDDFFAYTKELTERFREK